MSANGKSAEEDHLKYQEVQQILKGLVQDKLHSCVKLYLIEKLQAKQIPKSNGTNGIVSNFKELKEEFARDPDPSIFKAVYDILWVEPWKKNSAVQFNFMFSMN